MTEESDRCRLSGECIRDEREGRFSGPSSYEDRIAQWIGWHSRVISQTVDDVRNAIVARAEQAFADNEPYGLYDRSGNFPPGSYKCNEFVCDVVNASGARIPLNVDEHGNAWPPLAGTLGDPKAKIPGWIVVTDPQPGDIVAQQRGYSDASGHSGIIVDSDLNVVSAREGGVSKDPLKTVFPDNYRGDDFQKGPVVFRRYIGGN